MADRIEVTKTYPLAGGRLVTLILRDKITPEDIVVNRTRAFLLAARTGEAIDIVPVHRRVKDLIIKSAS